MRLCYHESNATDRSPQSANPSIRHMAMLPVRPINPQYGHKQELGKVYVAKPSNAAHDAEVHNPLEILVRNIALINEIYSINVGIQMHGDALTRHWPCPKQTKHGASLCVIWHDAAIGFLDVFNTYRTIAWWRVSRGRNMQTIAQRSVGRETSMGTESEYKTRSA